MSAAERITLWPCPDELITGFTTHGIPISATASSNSPRVPANLYGDVGNPSSSAASRRIPSRFMVSSTALAVGTTL